MATAGMEAKLEELDKRKRELDAAISEERKLARRTSLRAARTAKSLPSLVLELGAGSTAGLADVVISPALAAHADKKALLALYDLSGHCAELAASWLLGQGRSTSGHVDYDAAARQQTIAGVEWLYIKSPQELLASLLDPAPPQTYCLERYVVEYKLFHWLVDQNCDKGIAPSHKQLREQAANLVPDAMPMSKKTQMTKFFLENTRATRHWIVSFRQRWGVKPGAIVVGETLDPGVLRDRVSWLA
jgi:hypothetical protein